MVRIFQDANPTRNSLSTRGLCDPPSLAQDREKLHALAAPLRTLPERPRPQEPNNRTENGSLPDPFSPQRRVGWHSEPSAILESVLTFYTRERSSDGSRGCPPPSSAQTSPVKPAHPPLVASKPQRPEEPQRHEPARAAVARSP